MAPPLGCDMGGLRTIEDLRDRCMVDEDSGCWHWRGCIHQGRPLVWFRLNGKKYRTRGRRAAVLLSGRTIKPGHETYATDNCWSDDCVNPAHCRTGSREKMFAWMVATGRSRSIVKIAKATMRCLARRKLTMAQAEAVRTSDEPARDLARRYGMNVTNIYKIRRGASYKPALRGASVFSQ